MILKKSDENTIDRNVRKDDFLCNKKHIRWAYNAERDLGECHTQKSH